LYGDCRAVLSVPLHLGLLADGGTPYGGTVTDKIIECL
jgi:hypothetical protein